MQWNEKSNTDFFLAILNSQWCQILQYFYDQPVNATNVVYLFIFFVPFLFREEILATREISIHLFYWCETIIDTFVQTGSELNVMISTLNPLSSHILPKSTETVFRDELSSEILPRNSIMIRLALMKLMHWEFWGYTNNLEYDSYKYIDYGHAKADGNEYV